MVFIALEGFSGTGKTTISRNLYNKGWVSIPESAHVVPDSVPLADRGNTYSDYALIGASLMRMYEIASLRKNKYVVADGYIVSDLTYAKIRYEKGLSNAYPALYNFVKSILGDENIVPDLFIVLTAKEKTIKERQRFKEERDKNLSKYFMKRYYRILYGLHKEMRHKFVNLSTDDDIEVTAEKILQMVGKL
jgi:thymidylate kinase